MRRPQAPCAADADARLRELCAARGAVFPVLGALAAAFVEGRLHEELGYRCVGDWSRQKLGVGARTLRDQARVFRRLQALPRLREAVDAGEVSFSVARLVVSLVSPETEEACLADVRNRTVRAVEGMVRAVREAQGMQADDPALATDEDAPRVRVRLGCPSETAGMWRAAVELARRVAGESLPVAECARWIVAEAVSAVGSQEPEPEPAPAPEGPGQGRAQESGLREGAWPRLSWRAARRAPPRKLVDLTRDLAACDAHEVARRLRSAHGFLQARDLAIGRVLRLVLARQLHRRLGFDTFERYVRERLDLAPRTARRLAALARVEDYAPPVATAFQQGRITALQARVLARVIRSAGAASASAWVAHARRVSLRRLEEEADAVPRQEIDFWAPPDVAADFLAMVRRVGLERLLAHVIRTWMYQGEQFVDYADFERDGHRCTAPCCTARSGLESHHIRYRSHGGPDVPWNRTTLCQYHHRHAVHGPHAGRVRILGRAPDELVFLFGGPKGEIWRSGDVRVKG